MLRRPLVIIAAAFAAGAAVYRLIADARGGLAEAVFCMISVAGLLLLCTSYIANDPAASAKMRQALSLFAVFMVLGACRMGLSLHQCSQFADMQGAQVLVQGQILRTEQKDEEHIYAVLKLMEGAEGSRGAEAFGQEKERMLVTVEGMTGDRGRLQGCFVRVSGRVEVPEGPSDPGGFDYRMYLRSRKILSTMKTSEGCVEIVRLPSNGWRWMGRIEDWKQRYEAAFMQWMSPEAAGMLCGILFGDDTFLSEEIRDTFGENGIGHLLATSGLHTGFVYSILYVLFRRPGTMAGHLPIIACLGVYAALAGFSASVVRAVLMIIVLIVGRVCFRRTDFLTNIALCALILLVWEPTYLFASGFQLSFTAVITLAIILPKLEARLALDDDEEESDELTERINSIYKKAISLLTGMAALQLGMTPLILRNFHYISISGLFLNTPAIFLAGLIVPAGMILMPISLLMPSLPVLPFAFFLLEKPVRLLIRLNDTAAAGGRACIYLPSPPMAAFMCWYLLLIFLFSESGTWLRKRGRTAGASVLAMILLISLGTGALTDGVFRQSEMIFVDVGQGDCAHLKADGGTILFDAGGSETRDVGKEILMPYLLGSGTGRIDAAVLSHLHTDHYGGLKTLKDYVPVDSLILSAAYRSMSGQLAEETGVPEDRMLFLERGDKVTLFGVQMTALAPFHRSPEEFAAMARDEKEENNCCLVLRADYMGESFLFTGDIDSELEERLAEADSDADTNALAAGVLKAAHHGSKYSSSLKFLEAVHPDTCVIQVGARNLYGHPSPEALERMETVCNDICRTDRQGAIMFDLNGKTGKKVRTMREQEEISLFF